MRVSTWIKTPPQVDGKLVRLKYKNTDNPKRVFQGLFYWNSTENTFIESVPGPDGFALYPDHGWRIVAWQEYKER